MSTEALQLIKVRAYLEPGFRVQLMSNPLQFLQEYDLTEDEKRQIILPNFGWLFENKLAAMAYPESEDAFTVLSEIGIHTRHIPVPDSEQETVVYEYERFINTQI